MKKIIFKQQLDRDFLIDCFRLQIFDNIDTYENCGIS